MKFLVDMNLSRSWVSFLRSAGFEAENWSAIGASDASDSVIIQWAADNGYIVLRSDLDFGAILAASRRASPSVFQIRAGRLSPQVIGREVLSAIEQTKSALESGALVSCEVTRHKVRILPL